MPMDKQQFMFLTQEILPTLADHQVIELQRLLRVENEKRRTEFERRTQEHIEKNFGTIGLEAFMASQQFKKANET